MRVLDLFSGIGGFSFGLERAGMTTVAFCEQDNFCRQVLAKHWPDVDCYHDVTKLDTAEFASRHGCPDVICGGFPCQDISVAGKGAGLAGARSGLWREFHRLIRDLKPKWVVIENVSALKSRGLDTVLSDLAAIGYDAEWHCIPAAYVGAPHRRDRIWIIAYPGGNQLWDEQQRQPRGQSVGVRDEGAAQPGDDGAERHATDAAGQRIETSEGRAAQHEGRGVTNAFGAHVADAAGGGCGEFGPGRELGGRREAVEVGEAVPDADDGPGRRVEPQWNTIGRDAVPTGDGAQGAALADTDGRRLESERQPQHAGVECARGDESDGCGQARRGHGPGVLDTHSQRQQEYRRPRPAGEEIGSVECADWWEFEPDVGRVVDGIPNRVDRLKSLGNSIVWQIAYMIGMAIMQAEGE